tara:strand:- start:1098 stop:1955 length:858 start_codon:yes stop_codon:yes gene_type:complete
MEKVMNKVVDPDYPKKKETQDIKDKLIQEYQGQQVKESQFPTEEVDLPSKGLVYPKESPLSSGKIEMKYMTAKEEDILSNQNFIKNGTVIDKVLRSLIVSPINYNDLLIGDKNAVLYAARVLGYGKDYEAEVIDPETGEKQNVTIDLSEVKNKELDDKDYTPGENSFTFILPTSKITVCFKLLTHHDENKIEAQQKAIKKSGKPSAEITTRLKNMIVSVNGDDTQKTIDDFIDTQLLARDSAALRNEALRIMPDLESKFTYFSESSEKEFNIEIPIGINFFWPGA